MLSAVQKMTNHDRYWPSPDLRLPHLPRGRGLVSDSCHLLQGGKGKASKAKAAGAASPSTPSQPIPTAASRSAPASAPLPILRNPPGASPGGSAVHAEGASPSTPVGQYMKGRKGQQHSAVGAADAAFGSSPGSECGESGGNGRRARRAAKKAAADARAAAIPGF